jgi:hypothetical protein
MKPVLFTMVCISLIFLGCAKVSTTNSNPKATDSKTPTVASSCLPQIADSARLSKNDVNELARCYDLIGHQWQVNPHLEFKEGDISFWTEQNLTKRQLICEFESRQKALQDAEKTGEKIKTQGDLSYKAGKFMSSDCR